MDSVRKGGCTVPNPFSHQSYFVSLVPADVHLLNFWTKAPGALIKYIEPLRDYGYKIACFISQTDYPRYLENAVPPFEDVRDAVKLLRKQLLAVQLWWRYDPLIITKRLSPAWHIRNFTRLCRDVWRGNTERVIVAHAHIDGPYKSISKVLEAVCLEHNDELVKPSYEEIVELASRLRNIASEWGIKLEVCCSPAILQKDASKIAQAQCLSLEYLRRIVPDLPSLKIKHLRKRSEKHGYAACQCVESRDIGMNGTCRHGCVYCYANRRELKALQRVVKPTPREQEQLSRFSSYPYA